MGEFLAIKSSTICHPWCLTLRAINKFSGGQAAAPVEWPLRGLPPKRLELKTLVHTVPSSLPLSPLDLSQVKEGEKKKNNVKLGVGGSKKVLNIKIASTQPRRRLVSRRETEADRGWGRKAHRIEI